MTDRRRRHDRSGAIEALALQLDALLDELDESHAALSAILARPLPGPGAGTEERTAAP